MVWNTSPGGQLCIKLYILSFLFPTELAVRNMAKKKTNQLIPTVFRYNQLKNGAARTSKVYIAGIEIHFYYPLKALVGYEILELKPCTGWQTYDGTLKDERK